MTANILTGCVVVSLGVMPVTLCDITELQLHVSLQPNSSVMRNRQALNEKQNEGRGQMFTGIVTISGVQQHCQEWHSCQ